MTRKKHVLSWDEFVDTQAIGEEDDDVFRCVLRASAADVEDNSRSESSSIAEKDPSQLHEHDGTPSRSFVKQSGSDVTETEACTTNRTKAVHNI